MGRGPWVQSVEPGTLDLRVLSSSPTLGTELTLDEWKNNLKKIKKQKNGTECIHSNGRRLKKYILWPHKHQLTFSCQGKNKIAERKQLNFQLLLSDDAFPITLCELCPFLPLSAQHYHQLMNSSFFVACLPLTEAGCLLSPSAEAALPQT